MYKCVFCGLESQIDNARFCGDCGPEGPGSNWLPQDIDRSLEVAQYIEKVGECFFDNHSEIEIEKFSLRHRARLKISHSIHLETLRLLHNKKESIAELSKFKIEFNQNVTDAYAGNDTFLEFRITNLTNDERLKVSLIWDDQETIDVIDLRAETKYFIKPSACVTLGGKVVFDTAGIKEISDLIINITDDFGKVARFRADPFRFKVISLDQKLVQNISTHNQISIEGRGVVDASGMGRLSSEELQSKFDAEKWMTLSFVYLPENNFYEALAKAVTPSFIGETQSEESKEYEVNEHLLCTDLNDEDDIKLNSTNEHNDILCISSLGDFTFPNCETTCWYGEVARSFNGVENLEAYECLPNKVGKHMQWYKREPGRNSIISRYL